MTTKYNPTDPLNLGLPPHQPNQLWGKPPPLPPAARPDPNSKSSTNFKFQQPNIPINWSKVAALPISQILTLPSPQSIPLLTKYLPYVALGDLGANPTLYAHESVVKGFKTGQLCVQYLCYCQNVLESDSAHITADINKTQHEINQAAKREKVKDDEVKRLRKEERSQVRLIQQYHRMLKKHNPGLAKRVISHGDGSVSLLAVDSDSDEEDEEEEESSDEEEVDDEGGYDDRNGNGKVENVELGSDVHEGEVFNDESNSKVENAVLHDDDDAKETIDSGVSAESVSYDVINTTTRDADETGDNQTVTDTIQSIDDTGDNSIIDESAIESVNNAVVTVAADSTALDDNKTADVSIGDTNQSRSVDDIEDNSIDVKTNIDASATESVNNDVATGRPTDSLYTARDEDKDEDENKNKTAELAVGDNQIITDISFTNQSQSIDDTRDNSSIVNTNTNTSVDESAAEGSLERRVVVLSNDDNRIAIKSSVEIVNGDADADADDSKYDDDDDDDSSSDDEEDTADMMNEIKAVKVNESLITGSESDEKSRIDLSTDDNRIATSTERSTTETETETETESVASDDDYYESDDDDDDDDDDEIDVAEMMDEITNSKANDSVISEEEETNR